MPDGKTAPEEKVRRRVERGEVQTMIKEALTASFAAYHGQLVEPAFLAFAHRLERLEAFALMDEPKAASKTTEGEEVADG